MKYKIGVITHYHAIEDAFKHLQEPLDCEFYFRIGAMEYAIAHAIELCNVEKVDAIVSVEVTSSVINDHVDIPVFTLGLKNYDLVKAFHQGRSLGERIAFLEIRPDLRHHDFDQVKQILGYDISHYTFNDMSEAEVMVDMAVQDGNNVVVTTGHLSFEYARLIKLPAVMVIPEEKEFISVINILKSVVTNLKKEDERVKWLNEIVCTSSQGVITLDSDERITVINGVAENMLGLCQRDLTGKNVHCLNKSSPLLKKILQIPPNNMEIIQNADDEYIVTRIDLASDAEGHFYMGSIFRLNELKNIQNMEMSARKKFSDKGLVANSTFQDIAGMSAVLKKTMDTAKCYARTDSIILINGETGSGKELFAQSIHNYSECKSGPFVAINCSTLSENLLESELFGYEDGAFTGARKGGRAGLFEIAHNGTFFLDEIGEIPLQLQARLLRVLQERRVMRIGGSRNIPVNVRIILATNRDLYAEVKGNRFREDLYYRINVLNLHIPPLRERKEDIEPIVQNIMGRIRARGVAGPHLSSEIIARFKRYDWHGNVRELQNFVERLMAQGLNDVQSVDRMLDELISANQLTIQPTETNMGSTHLTLAVGTMRDMEKEIIRRLYDYYGGDKRKLEHTLNMSSTTLWRRFKAIQ